MGDNANNVQQIIIVGDDNEYRKELDIILKFIGISATLIQSHTLAKLDCKTVRCIICCDPDVDSDLINQFKQINTDFSHIFFIGLKTDNQENLPDSLAREYLDFPFNQIQLLASLDRMAKSSDYVDSTPLSQEIESNLVGDSKLLRNLRKTVIQVGRSDVNVLILGESGAGKEVVAKCLHLGSHRKNGPFVPVNCGAIPSELLESELFGHEKGAFTGAFAARKGRFELAQGGTIFLDEIGDMPLNMQVKLLRVLQERCFERVGSNKSITADVRVIAATHRNLEKAIGEGDFREDLYYRLNVFPIEMPSLRARIIDLPLLIKDIVQRLGQYQHCTLRFTDQAITKLSEYEWPGNIRELANLVERMMVLFPNGIVDATDLPAKYCKQTPVSDLEALEELEETNQEISSSPALLFNDDFNLKEYLQNAELAFIKQALDASDGVVARAANYLNIRRTTLVEKMRKYGIKREELETCE